MESTTRRTWRHMADADGCGAAQSPRHGCAAALSFRGTAFPMRSHPRLSCLVRALLVACFVAAAVAQRAAAADSRRPNILFLFADDYCFDTIRALGNREVETPNLDRLVERGTTFTHAYNMGSWTGAVCVASRTMLITGRSLWQANAIHKNTNQERLEGRLWPQLMEAAGYQTYMTGKWHINTDATKTFQVARNVRGGMPKDTPEGYQRPVVGKPDPWSPSDPKFGGFWAGGKHWSEVVGDDALDFLAEARRQPMPFFMYIAFNAPHDPRQSPAEYVARYPAERIAVPRNFLPEYPHKDAIGLGPKLRDENLAPHPRTEYAVKVHRQEYYAIITHLDAQIGRILEALDRSGEAERTWIFFTADHGLAVGQHGMFGKQNMYDHSLRVPFIVAGPGVAKRRKVDGSIYLQDIMPTALELAGARKPEHVFFNSLLPQLRGQRTTTHYPAVYSAYLQLQRAVTKDGFKLIVYPQARVARLYHVAKDPLEMTDLAADPRHADTRRKLFSELLRLQAELEDTLDLRGAFPEMVAAR